ncbi:hypothetical protein CKAN_02253300 [Cinnamomum micranthum f. kanehirae]|uniref:Uncharacterized protein n=1 Tax=Cinnamomum micranthum f. kanehirae TaxID=337451 RepID=A0A3S3R296_9MAGN|nr:hypothetical protein CKAN_02253300 [Cinnamomum micranthum f. kanehirae]
MRIARKKISSKEQKAIPICEAYEWSLEWRGRNREKSKLKCKTTKLESHIPNPTPFSLHSLAPPDPQTNSKVSKLAFGSLLSLLAPCYCSGVRGIFEAGGGRFVWSFGERETKEYKGHLGMHNAL